MGAAQALRSLDRRVLPADPRSSPHAWRQAARRWWLLLVVAGAYAVAAVLVVALLDSNVARIPALCGLLPWTVVFGYLAAAQKAEHDRLNGRDPLAKHRPPGL